MPCSTGNLTEHTARKQTCAGMGKGVRALEGAAVWGCMGHSMGARVQGRVSTCDVHGRLSTQPGVDERGGCVCVCACVKGLHTNLCSAPHPDSRRTKCNR